MKVTAREMPGLERAAIRAALPAMRHLQRVIPDAMLIHEYQNRTFDLESSTHTSLDPVTGRLRIWNDSDHARFVEKGTRYMRALPFMLPALVRFFGKVRP